MSAHQVIDSGGVNISSGDAAEIGRLLQLLAPSENTIPGLVKSVSRLERGGALRSQLDSCSLMSAARHIYAQRRVRNRHFPDAFFGEPAWDMLLVLYSTEDDESRQSIGNLISLASCPPTTGLRYLASLEENGFIERLPHPTDGRVFYVSLSGKGREAIEAYLRSVLES